MSKPKGNAASLIRTIGRRVYALRTAAGMTMEAFGVRADRTKGYVSRIESGNKRPTLETLEAFAQHLGVEVLDLFLDPGPDNLRHRVIEATRSLPQDRLRAMLASSSGVPVPAPTAPPFEEVAAPRPGVPSPGVLPLLGLDVAAGGFDFEHIERGTRWVRPHTTHRFRRGYFVARVVGRSMEPTIHDGEYVLFSKKVPSDLENETVVLAQYGGLVDADTAASFTVKRIRRVAGPRRSEPKWARVELVPDNPNFDTVVIEPDRFTDLDVVAVLVEVLRPKDAA